MNFIDWKKKQYPTKCNHCKENFHDLCEEPFVVIDTTRKVNFSKGYLTHKYDTSLILKSGHMDITNDGVIGWCKECIMRVNTSPYIELVEHVVISEQELLMTVHFTSGIDITVKTATRYDNPLDTIFKNWNRVVNTLNNFATTYKKLKAVELNGMVNK